jgi:hypothetical protein
MPLRSPYAPIAAIAIAGLMAHTGAAAAGSVGCASAGGGALNAELAASTSATRSVTLAAGDVLDFAVRAGATVSLISGPGAPLTLSPITTSGSVSFKAPETGDYAFSITASAAEQGGADIACTSAQAAAANAAFLARRKDLLNAREPDRIRIDRESKPAGAGDNPLGSNVALDAQGNPQQVEFSVSLSDIAAASHPGKKVEPSLVDLWVEGRMQNYEATMADLGMSSGNLGVLYIGTRTMLGSDILVGGLAQVDRGVESAELGDTRMAATGWMAGPYMSMKLGSGVTFDGRAAWGTTDNAMPGIAIADSETERRLLRAKLTSTRDVEGWKVAPSLGLVYLEDAVHDDTSGATKAAGTGRVELMPEVSRRFQVNGETFVEPRAAVGGFVGFEDLGALKPMVTTESAADLRLKAEAGVAVGIKDGSSLAATGGVESGDATTPENWTGRLQLNMPLGK